MFPAGVSQKLVQQRTGHKSLEALHQYEVHGRASALLASQPRASCFIFHIALAAMV